MHIRALKLATLPAWQGLRQQLWPHHSPAAHRADGERILSSRQLASFLALDDAGQALGFADAAIRQDYVNGCDGSPVVFLEGVFVAPAHRKTGIARQLVAAVRAWGLERGCAELASDAPLDNLASQRMHAALGFEETERVVFFRMALD
ncbi:aminoglycoside 6'-N-acetyltransferase I [Chromobacterium alkanivorans]|uniref:aminoglycoside 6'-N-acetyltransferase n=1 Tax=Chromobacterium alkanivorans TaxID=1071719 RepID=UPI001967189D|nr:aminoglycoside 6'-N-acetyltransferase [Chromobacterium alkanivorans]MBN3002880.1 GNAT family N-acetyltransferase [Chromobacterium alkanivorans]MCS3803961.1 aminoglycoside 6'-N-acetyltransferase I [Chromobacterium alkanivorans]MCS3817934.1 aminoglycoside 6'-N-acetyltransferase I [Chromobacterium alkanivorans]MCS3875554.1 aminoglycoside 6'-N-acetyltransferase I [Chromobacterium alkanivorans]